MAKNYFSRQPAINRSFDERRRFCSGFKKDLRGARRQTCSGGHIAAAALCQILRTSLPMSCYVAPTSPEPAVGVCRSAFAVHVTSRRWLRFLRCLLKFLFFFYN